VLRGLQAKLILRVEQVFVTVRRGHENAGSGHDRFSAVRREGVRAGGGNRGVQHAELR